MMKKILCLILIAAAVLIGLSGAYHEPDGSVEPLFGQVKLRLSSGDYPLSAGSLVAVVTEQDLEHLELFKELSYADFSGSLCYEALAAWAQAHPEVQVVYTVALPDGSTVYNDATQVDISGYGPEDVQALISALGALPELEQVTLGTLESDGGLGLEDLALLRQALPEVSFQMELELLGKTYTPQATAVDLTGLEPEQVQETALVLSMLTELNTVVLGQMGELSWDDLTLLGQACPDAVFDCAFTLYGKELNLQDDSLDINHTAIDDQGALVRQILPLMRACTYVDMDYCGVSNEAMAQIREENPDKEVVWRIWFGENYSVRTDVERILASKPTVGGMIYDGSVLQYCTKVKYLDLGHNTDLADISFVSSMPDLEVLIVAMTAITDLSPLRNCPKLEYLEIQTNAITDLSPLENCTELAHLNICELPGVTDATPLMGLTKLERLWIGTGTPIPADQIQQLRSSLPNCQVNDTTGDPHGDSWRFSAYDPDEPKYYWVPRHELLREQLGYNYQEYSFYWLDPLCGDPAPAEYAGMFGKEVYGLE